MRVKEEFSENNSKDGISEPLTFSFLLLIFSLCTIPMLMTFRFDFDLPPVNLVTVLNNDVKFLETTKTAFGESYSREIRNQSMDFYMTLGYFYESKRDFYESNYNHSLLVIRPHLRMYPEYMESFYRYYVVDPSNLKVKNLNNVQQNLVFETPFNKQDSYLNERNKMNFFYKFTYESPSTTNELFKRFINIYVLPLYLSKNNSTIQTNKELDTKLKLDLILDLHLVSSIINITLFNVLLWLFSLLALLTVSVWIWPQYVFKNSIANASGLTIVLVLYVSVLLLILFNLIISMIMIHNFEFNELACIPLIYDFVTLGCFVTLGVVARTLSFKTYQFTQGIVHPPNSPNLFKSPSFSNFKKIFNTDNNDNGEYAKNGPGSSTTELEMIIFETEGKKGVELPRVAEYATSPNTRQNNNDRRKENTKRIRRNSKKTDANTVYSNIYPTPLTQFTEGTSAPHNSTGEEGADISNDNGYNNDDIIKTQTATGTNDSDSGVINFPRHSNIAADLGVSVTDNNSSLRKFKLRKYSLNLINSEYRSPKTGLTLNSEESVIDVDTNGKQTVTTALKSELSTQFSGDTTTTCDVNNNNNGFYSIKNNPLI